MKIPSGVLKNGSSGQTVKDLQRELKAHGESPGAIDGQFGKHTQAAVKKFQKAHHLAANGKVDAKTWKALGGDKFEAKRQANTPTGKLHADLAKMNKAQAGEKKAAAAVKTDTAASKTAQQALDAQRQQLTQQLSQTTDPAQQKAIADKLFALGQNQVKTQDKFDKKIAGDHAEVKHEQSAAKAAHKQALKDLKPAEYKMSLKATNKARHELGLKSIKHALRPPNTSSSAFKAARSVMGRNIQSLKYNGPLAKYLDKWPSSHVCCANFVSACLEKAGQIKPSQHQDGVANLSSTLSHDKDWSRTSLKNAKPGDVVCFDVPGEGHFAHTVLFAGWKNGSPQFIGSNNVNPDGSQRITQEHMGYAIDAIYHYHG